MNCNVYQDQILNYEQLTAIEQQAVDAHIHACPHCREVARAWRALDAALTRQLRAPELSARFDACVRQRIASEAATVSHADLAERRRALETEFAASRPRPNRRRWIPQALDVLGFGVAGGMGGWLLLTLLTRATAAWATLAPPTGPQVLAVSSVIGVALALGLVALGFRRPIRQAFLR